MRKLPTYSLALFCAFASSGCAYLTNYTRSVDLKESSYVMDVKQRLVFSQQRPGAKLGAPMETVVCAEPSPDALTVIGVSGGFSLNSGKADTVANAGGALSESGAFVGLRTHSIQLLRDAMYRLCEGYAGGAVTAPTFQSMQRRYQSTMMGLIAIEQLTGPVLASQALLTTSSAAQAGASAGDAAVAKAQERVDSTAQDKLAAQAKLDEQEAKVEAAQKKVQDMNRQLATARAKTPPNSTAIADLEGQLDKLTQDQAAARRDHEAARRALTVADEAARSAFDQLRGANSRVSASASGAGKLGDVSGAIAASNQSLTEAVVDIVREINISYLRDSCISFSADLLRDPALVKSLQELRTDDVDKTVSPTPMVRALIDTCKEILKEDARSLSEAVQRAPRSNKPSNPR